MNSDMKKRLKSFLNPDKLISVYTDADEPNSFTLGFPLQMDENHILLNMVNRFGEENGFCSINLDDIYIYDDDKLYSGKMNTLFTMKNQRRKQIEDINDSIANQFYNKNRDQFIRDKEYVKYLDITTDDSKKAWDIYRSANKDNFVTLASQYSKTPTFDSTNIPYTATETIPAEIRQAINSLHVNSISTPIKAEDGYHIINLLEKLDEGGMCSFKEVRKDIINQIITNNQKEMVEKKLADLRTKSRVDFNLNLISDSIKN
jgi:parvulin-like peptidyl-prolyl isomerase